MLAQLNAQAAVSLAERIRQAFSQNQSLGIGVLGVSIGVADAETQGYNLDKLLFHADKAMYSAKESGRNCVRMMVCNEG